MNKAIIALGVTILSTVLSFSAQTNSYQQEYGNATIVPVCQAYPAFQMRMPSEVPFVPEEIHVVIASSKQVKINAMKALFEKNSRFSHVRKTFDSINAPSEIENQPIGIDAGRLGALNRIQNAKKIFDLKACENTYFAAIENYFEADTVDAPRDHAFVIIQSPNGALFEAVSVGVAIHKDVYAAAVCDKIRLPTGYSVTIGSYLQARYGFDESDWFNDVLGKTETFSRIDQILSTLETSEWF